MLILAQYNRWCDAGILLERLVLMLGRIMCS